MEISIVIPCYRSEKTIENVVNEIREQFKDGKHNYQIILVNDCSPDNVFDVIKRLCEEDTNIIGVNLSRNYGQASAKLAAIEYITGEVTVFMDDDGQHDPAYIFDLVNKVNEGYDVVYAHFSDKKHSAVKRVTSAMQRQIAIWVGNSPKSIYGSSFLAYSRFIIDSLKKYKSPFVSIGGYIMQITTKFANIEVPHRERQEGRSGYTFKKLFSLWLNTVTNFSIVPIKVATFLGFLSAIIGAFFGMFTIIRKLIYPSIPAGYTSTIAIILFVGGIIMLILGFIGEYIGRIYMTISNTPQYTVREVIEHNEKSKPKKDNESD